MTCLFVGGRSDGKRIDVHNADETCSEFDPATGRHQAYHRLRIGDQFLYTPLERDSGWVLEQLIERYPAPGGPGK